VPSLLLRFDLGALSASNAVEKVELIERRMLSPRTLVKRLLVSTNCDG